MIHFFKRLIADLKKENHTPERIRNIKLSLALITSGLSASLALGMLYFGYGALSILMGSLLTFSATFALPLLFITKTNSKIAQWIDDHFINPPNPITLPAVTITEQKINELAQTITLIEFAKAESIEIGTIKANLKALFGLRSYQSLSDDEFNHKLSTFKEDFERFKGRISLEANWKNQQNIDALKPLVLDAVLLSDAILAKIEQEILANNKSVTTNEMADLLTDNSKPHAKIFLDSALVGLYHFARGNAHFANGLIIRSSRFTECLAEFYQEGTVQNDVRKIFNTFIKHGFDKRYGEKAFRQRLQKANDLSIEKSTKVDSKRTQKFNALP